MSKFTNTWAKVFEKTINNEVFSLLSKNKLDYLEIGIYEGQSACMVLDKLLVHPESTYTGVDLWSSGKRKIAESNLKKYKNVKIISGNSMHVLEKLANEENSFDIIYIDGNHSFDYVLSDTVLAWELSKKIIIWDDYKRDDYGVKSAVEYFLEDIDKEQYEVIVNDYQFAIQKTTYGVL